MSNGMIKLWGLIGFVLILICCLFFKFNSIESDVLGSTKNALQKAGIAVGAVAVSGRDIILEGNVASEEIKKKAEQVIWNDIDSKDKVRMVDNRLKVMVVPPPKPKAEVIQKKLDNVIAINNIEFETNRSIIRSNSYPIINNVIDILKEYPNVTIKIEGHTDSRGKAEHNLKLSANRAKAVMDFIVTKGISPERLSSVGYGETLPIAGNRTIEGRQKNRRVEFKINQEN